LFSLIGGMAPPKVRASEESASPNIRPWRSKMAKKTGKAAAKSASKVLQDERTAKDSKAAAGSALSQREKQGKRAKSK
jgi:hypothetical protein